MNINKLEEKLQELGQPAFRMKQIQKAVFQDDVASWEEITTIPKNLRALLSNPIAKLDILSFGVEKVLAAKDGQSVKALLKLPDGNLIETVLISPMPETWAACISCQVGCLMGCQFCATGKLGLKRNLTAEEITDQVLFWRQYMKNNLKFKIENLKFSIVYMGMGEPFLNWDNVRESLENLINPDLFGFGSRSISVSTAGIPEGIEKLAEEFPQVNLALSLHFADDQKRSEIMPINRKNNLEALKKSLQNYFAKTKRKVFLEYVMLQEINDRREDADKLVRFVKSIGKLQLLHVNLIRYNETGSDFKASSKERTNTFKEYLLQNHIPVTIRKSLGEEIQGACGQLAGK